MKLLNYLFKHYKMFMITDNYLRLQILGCFHYPGLRIISTFIITFYLFFISGVDYE